MDQKKSPELEQVLLHLVRARLFLPLLIVSLAAICIAGYVGEQTVVNQQHQLALSQAQMVDRYLDQAGRVLDAVGRVAESSTPVETASSMQGTWEAYRYFDTLYYLDNNNTISRMVPSDPRYLGLDMSNFPAYPKAGDIRNISISRPFISLRTGDPTVYVVRPLSAGGAVVGELSLNSLQQEILGTNGESGKDFIIIMDQSGMLLAHPSVDLVRQQTNQGNLEIFHRGLSGEATQVYDYSGTTVLGSAVRVDRSGWVVIDQVPLSVALGPYAWTLGLTFLASIIIWLALAWDLRKQLRQQVVNPVVQLSEGATALAKGDFSQGRTLASIPTAFAEMDKLAADFQYMNSEVQKRQTALQKSEERYRAAYEQLSATEEELRANYEELTRTGEELQESERKFRAIFDQTFQFIGLMTPDGMVIEANQTALKFSGITEHEVLGKPLWETPWWSHSEEMQEKLRAAIQDAAKGEFVRFEATHPATDGRLHYVDFSLKPVMDETGHVVLLIPEGRDITERKEGEQQIAEYTRFLTTLMDTLPIPMFYKGVDGKYLGCNQMFAEYFGVSRSELIGKTVYTIAPEDLADRDRAADQEIFNNPVNQSYEIQVRFAVGSRHDVIFYKAPFFNNDGSVGGLIGAFIDITELKMVQEALNQVTRKLSLLNSITFTDIQSAVFSLSGYFELEKTIPMDETLQQYLDKQIRIVQGISQALQFAKSYQSLGLKPPAWQNVQQSFLFGISHLDISKLSRRLNVKGLEIYADPLLENVFFTLAENVVLHGKTATEIVFRYQESPEGLTLFFEDNGVGIQNDMKQKIFDRRYEEKKGMGLFLVCEILSITGITIEETGEPGKGARFEITVPKGVYRFTGYQ